MLVVTMIFSSSMSKVNFKHFPSRPWDPAQQKIYWCQVRNSSGYKTMQVRKDILCKYCAAGFFIKNNKLKPELYSESILYHMHDDEDNKLSDTLFVTCGGVLTQGYCRVLLPVWGRGGGGGGVGGTVLRDRLTLEHMSRPMKSLYKRPLIGAIRWFNGGNYSKLVSSSIRLRRHLTRPRKSRQLLYQRHCALFLFSNH